MEEPAIFVWKHLWAGLYGGLLGLAMYLSALGWQDGWALPRNDLLFLVAVALQVAFLALHVETPSEARALAAFGLMGLGMELFKVAEGSWSYEQEGVFMLGGVPLFVAFAYAAVPATIMRMLRLFDMRFAPFPPIWALSILAAAIYLNFFTFHYTIDIRLVLFAATVLMFGRTWIWFRVGTGMYRMPMLVSLFGVALSMWLAENLGTLTGTWRYADQQMGEAVNLATMGSWFLMICVALAVVLLADRRFLSHIALARS